MQLKSRTDFLAGVFFAVIGLAALWFGRAYETGTASAMGPGYFPRLLGWTLVGLGVLIALRALRRAGSGYAVRFKARPLLIMVGNVALFGFLLDKAGLALAGVLLILVSRLAAPNFRWIEVLSLAIGLTGAALLIFGYGLGIPFKFYPW